MQYLFAYFLKRVDQRERVYSDLKETFNLILKVNENRVINYSNYDLLSDKFNGVFNFSGVDSEVKKMLQN